MRAETPSLKSIRLAFQRDGTLGENCRSVKKCSVVFFAIQAMANANTGGLSGYGKSNLAAEATACVLVHFSPLPCSIVFQDRI